MSDVSMIAIFIDMRDELDSLAANELDADDKVFARNSARHLVRRADDYLINPPSDDDSAGQP